MIRSPVLFPVHRQGWKPSLLMRSVRRSAFTLTELLIVIAIIGILMALIFSALKSGWEKARLLKCKSNLRQWHVVHTLYFSDHQELLPTVQQWGGRYPSFMRGSGLNTLSVEALEPYLDQANTEERTLYGIFYCPSTRKDAFANLVENDWRSWNYFHTSYSYFARVGDWDPNVVVNPEELTDRMFASDRVLMTDILYRQGAGAWVYNHGVKGPSFHTYFSGIGPNDFGPPNITGIHVMYGDGRVEWKAREHFDLEAMNQWGNGSISLVRGSGGRDRSYW